MLANRPMIGGQVGPYELLSELGVGGAGEVYKGRHVETGNEAAIKVLLPQHAENEDVFRRFVREIGIAERLDDPHLVKHLDCSLHGDVLYYAMELVPWGSLRDILIQRDRLPWKEAVESAEHISSALAALHKEGIVHRDLKPDNVFLSDDGRLKIGDFGLARDLGATRLTIDGTTVGSMRYMAPEQVRGEDDLDGRVDLYALGCLLFEMVTGRLPFEGRATIDIFNAHVKETPPRASEFNPQIPRALDDLIAKLLEKSRDARPETATAVRTVLLKLLENDGNDVDVEALLAEVRIAPRTSAVEPAVPTSGEAVAESLTERLKNTEARPEVSAGRLAVIGVIVLVVAAIAWFATRSEATPDADEPSAPTADGNAETD
ncbi:serine/threonine-protein kinase [Stratiformator vulcanicus]|uniref:non-specific serine/threonine protein kinase n=1 Tax=Stratiformator vulcanicus TaxID=2527980 RepID=A0A517QXH4_9PLAN|nr:serine/threonine-protein kinase [Stratiformator vulcanicus]QDT36293.1 Serine/threonine-protein kinase PrkC [Stratiformator vulcanicus]